MRLKDEAKIRALFSATVHIVNQEGFASSSVNKIAKHANVSPATLYVYYENKEALIVSTYKQIKEELSQAIMADFKADLPIRENLKGLWKNLFQYITDNLEKYRYIDQFDNTPYVKGVDYTAIEAPYRALYDALDAGVASGDLKRIPRSVILAFVLSPAVFLARSRLGRGFAGEEMSVDDAFQLAWDAIAP